MNPLRLLPLLLLLLPLPALAQSGGYYYRLTGLSAGACIGSTGAVQLSGASIAREAYLPAGDIQTATMVSSTGGFAIGNPNTTFSIGPVGPASIGTFQSGVTTTPGAEPVIVTITVNSNVAPSFEARVTCAAALAAPQFAVVFDGSLLVGIPALHPGALGALSLLLALAGIVFTRRRGY